uniref:Uncharacterized protein n=1 Tax=Chromera velia CCMP2878 TaxID=1169474 RepID=A0A0G4ICX6_9ALVE|mmetsp:Transcript_49535/g.97521  ORF Transcript_49535/g.97521 Transcript_49535/m.97521 type:complete len:517 (-) Transcript_49535:655-2205(-)|eukprot:Cvel_13170.t1-p1 / transcript=Cvel_13170.t1 / gene=Cvel_13170 / organism=Chromera_velia_CCMP2878 / gene_product=hypothetical protein / transcript_product=hypothetical protein / location=Cvel_scaffold889:30196-35739(-) / protein_length=516 / sequence_SO=supercontig / SO=protein_coding / is_pseudo=false
MISARYCSSLLFKAQLASRASSVLSTDGGARRYSSLIPEAKTCLKYRITVPYSENSDWDDALIRAPDSTELQKFTKETPLFLRFFKLLCDQENRPNHFVEFAKRCESGLVVEKSAFVTKKELMETMWANGYSEAEMNAFSLAFPDDYEFHYPELAALFEVSEEDCYKFAMRKRMDEQALVQIKKEADPPAVRSFMWSYMLLAGTCATLTPFSNYVWMGKYLPSVMVLSALWQYFSKGATEKYYTESRMMRESIVAHKQEGQDLLFEKVKNFAHDSRCLDYLSTFRGELQTKLADYRKALIQQQKAQMAERLQRQLVAVQNAEAGIGASLQTVIVEEISASFREMFGKDPNMKKTSLDAAISAIEGKPVEDPVKKHFNEALENLEKIDLATAKADPNGSIVERVAAVYKEKEAAFLKEFTVSKAEAEEVKKLAAPAKSGSGFDFSKLDAKSMERLEDLFRSITGRLGLVSFDEKMLQPLATEDADAQSFVGFVNEQLEMTAMKIRNSRLSSFVAALG